MNAKFRKHFQGCSHGFRFTYAVRAQDARYVLWTRSDGLEGADTLVDWNRLYTPDNDNVVAPKPVSKRETRLAKKATTPAPPLVKPPTARELRSIEAAKRREKAKADKGRKR